MNYEREDLYSQVCNFDNLMDAWINAKKGKTKRRYVKRFQRDLKENLTKLHEELITQTYQPNPLKTFILRDPKTRKISKSAFRDRVVHHAVCKIIIPLFQRSFIYDSHANQIGKGTLKALERFDIFKRKASRNNTRPCYVLKADIKHYFEEVDHAILISLLRKKIKDEKVIWLIQQIIANTSNANRGGGGEREFEITKGMPLGNLTSQFFANVYLNELDQFVKHILKAEHYIRYIDDFVILHESKEQLEEWKSKINDFLKEKLMIELHPSKSHVLMLKSGINFLGFRVFYYHKLIRKSNLKNFDRKFNNLRILFDEEIIGRERALQSLEGWLAYCAHANTHKYRKHIVRNFNKHFSHGNRLLVHNKKNYINYIKRVKESELLFSVQKTLLHYKNGLNISEIAKKEGIKETTVWAHLANLVEHRRLSIWQVLSSDKARAIFNKIYSPKERLRDIKKRFKKDAVAYDEIACVMASIKSKRIKKKRPVTE